MVLIAARLSGDEKKRQQKKNLATVIVVVWCANKATESRPV
jgi:hypothetical protein